MKILVDENAWRLYKFNCEYCRDDINWSHEGTPKEFPCWVTTNTLREQTFNASSRVDLEHTFLYTSDLFRMLEEAKKILGEQK